MREFLAADPKYQKRLFIEEPKRHSGVVRDVKVDGLLADER